MKLLQDSTCTRVLLENTIIFPVEDLVKDALSQHLKQW